MFVTLLSDYARLFSNRYNDINFNMLKLIPTHDVSGVKYKYNYI